MTKVTLYYADWCGHCTKFKPTWEGIKQVFKLNNIKFEEFEDLKNENIIKQKGIEAYPTIIINKDKEEEYKYSGKMDPDSIITEVLPHLQLGGSKKYIIKYN